VSVDILGLPTHSIESGLLKGLHIHTYGIMNATDDIKSSMRCSQDFTCFGSCLVKSLLFFIACASTGPHFNPTNTTHGSTDSQIRHHGDLGNVVVFRNGTIKTVYQVAGVDLFGPYSIIGRSVVLHESEDDFGLKSTEMSRTTGSSGARIACGVIGWDKSESNAVETGLFSETMTSFNSFFDQLLDESNQIDGFLEFEDAKKNFTATTQRESIFATLFRSYVFL
jgi:hypothetical protein